MNIISIANTSESTAKTGTVLNIGACLRDKGYNVLLVDLDPRASLSLSVGFGPDRRYCSMYDVLCGQPDIEFSTIQKHGMDITLSHPDLTKVETELSTTPGKLGYLRQELRRLPMYHYILIDGPASTGFLMESALIASTHVIVLDQQQSPVAGKFKGLVQIIDTVQADFNKGLQPLRLSFATEGNHAECSETRNDTLDELNTAIQWSTKLSTCQQQGSPIIDWEEIGRSSKQFQTLTQELCSMMADPKQENKKIASRILADMKQADHGQ